MKKFMKTATLIMLAALACTVDAVAESVVSPDGGLSMTMLPLADRGAPSFTISYNGAVALPVVRVGLVTDRSNYADSMRLKSVSAAKVVTDDYIETSAKQGLKNPTIMVKAKNQSPTA